MTKFEFSGSGRTIGGGKSGLVAVVTAVIAVIAVGFTVLEWIAHRVWWLLGTAAGLGLLLFAGLLLMMRCNARWNSQYTQRYTQMGAQLRDELPRKDPPVIAPGVNLHLHGPEAAEVLARLLADRELPPSSYYVEKSSGLCRISTFP